MAYHSKKHKYKYRTRRERYLENMRVIRLILIFGAIALVILAYKNRYDWWGWVKTYFY